MGSCEVATSPPRPEEAAGPGGSGTTGDRE
jgi:hypothetical protein